MKWQALAKMTAVLILIFETSSCVAKGSVRDQSIDHILEMCKLLSDPNIETKAEGEVKFWYEAARVKASQELWNPAGIRAIEARLARAKGDDQKCLQRALREARKREAE